MELFLRLLADVRRIRWGTPAVALTGIAVAACGDGPAAPVPVARLTVSVDSIVFVGEAAQVRLVAYDSTGGLVTTPKVQWAIIPTFPWSIPRPPDSASPISGPIVALDTAAATVRALRPGRVWVVATSGAARDSALVYAEDKLSDPLVMTLADALEVAPGAAFGVGAVPGGQGWGINPDWGGRWYSSSPQVATWSPYEGDRIGGNTFSLVQLTAHSLGETILSVEYGGQRATTAFQVRDPGPLLMDELGICGLNAEGELWCKGDNGAGGLATLTATVCSRNCRQQAANVPVHGAKGMRFRAITTGLFHGRAHTCGISLSDARAYCWGFNHDHTKTLVRLAGPSGTQYCPEEGIFLAYQLMSCSFAPLAVDRTLDRQLVFRTIKAADYRTCGTTGAPGSPEEIWCWGDTDRPTKRSSFPSGWPTAS